MAAAKRKGNAFFIVDLLVQTQSLVTTVVVTEVKRVGRDVGALHAPPVWCGRDDPPGGAVVGGYDDFGRRAATERREKREETS
jgi:hypothetical protein